MASRPKWIPPFLRHLTTTGDFRLAAAEAGVGVMTVCKRRVSDEEFSRLCLSAFQLRAAWEDEWWERYYTMHPDDEATGEAPEPLLN